MHRYIKKSKMFIASFLSVDFFLAFSPSFFLSFFFFFDDFHAIRIDGSFRLVGFGPSLLIVVAFAVAVGRGVFFGRFALCGKVEQVQLVTTFLVRNSNPGSVGKPRN